jgi:hypothetical protein
LADQEAEAEDTSDPSIGVERVRVVQRVESSCYFYVVDNTQSSSFSGSFTYYRQLPRGGSEGIRKIDVLLYINVDCVVFFQIIILSLVRNSGASDDVELTGIISSGRANIGFLKVNTYIHVSKLYTNCHF